MKKNNLQQKSTQRCCNYGKFPHLLSITTETQYAWEQWYNFVELRTNITLLYSLVTKNSTYYILKPVITVITTQNNVNTRNTLKWYIYGFY